MSVNPYEETERLAVSGAGSREVESWALLELAKRLDRARAEHEQEKNSSALSEAVRLNWRAWTVIQSSLLDETNPLTPQLRGDLLSLCAFIDKHSTQLLGTPDGTKVQILIDINRHLGQGLRGERLNEAEQQAILKASSGDTDKQEKTEQGMATAQTSEPSTQKNQSGNEKKGEIASSPKTTPETTSTKKVESTKAVTSIAVDL